MARIRSDRMAGWSAIVVVAALAFAGCSSASAPAASIATAPPAAAPSPDSTPPIATPAASALVSPCLPLPHKAPAFERELPARIAGRQLDTWSMDGRLMILCLQGGSDANVAEIEAELAADGITLADITVVVTGRLDRSADPPYFIFAYRMAGHPGSEWPAAVGIDNPDEARFVEKTVAGKTVLVGDAAAVDQTEHARGRPYVWNSATTHYVVVTDDEAWATEALGLLH